MSRAILLVDHGSRRDDANAILSLVATAVREHTGSPVEIAHLELVPPDIAEGIDSCVRAGATEIVVHPYFLGPGMHTSRDIPAQLEAARGRHPGVSIRLTEPLGFHPGIVDVVLERLGDR